MKTMWLASALALCSFGMLQDNDPKAKTILDEVSKKTKAYTTMQAEFTLTAESSKKGGVNETTKGKATMKGSKFRLEIEGNTIVCDGKIVRTYAEGETEPSSEEPLEEMDDEMNPVKLLTIWEKGFKYRYVGEKKESSTAVHEIQLSPTNPSGTKKYHSVLVKIDKIKSLVHSVVIKKKNNDTTTLTITKFTPNVAVSDADFTKK